MGAVGVAILERDGFACVYCHRARWSLSEPLQLDHLVPYSLGGLDVPANLVACCQRCNASRGAKSVAAWAVYAAKRFGLTIDPAAIILRGRMPLPALSTATA